MRSTDIVRWGILSFLFGVLPVAFITQRGLESILVPLLGVFVAIGWLTGRFGWLLAVALLFLQGTAASRASGFSYREADRVILQVVEATRRLQPKPDPSEHIVIESDPFGEMEWGSLFVFRLALHEPELSVHRRSQISEVAPKTRCLSWSGEGGWK
jgi:hypothetical protein